MNRLTQKTHAASTTRFATYNALSAQRNATAKSSVNWTLKMLAENERRISAPLPVRMRLWAPTRQSFTTRDASPSDAPGNTIRTANLSTSRRSTPLYKAERGSTLMADAPLCALVSGAQRANATRASFRSTTILHSPPAWSYSPLNQRAPRLRISNRCAVTTTGLSAAREARPSWVVFAVLDIRANNAGSIHKNRSMLKDDQTHVDTAVAVKGSRFRDFSLHDVYVTG